MRHLLLILLLMFSVTTYSQVENKLDGSWKVIAIEDDEMYYNMEKDSIFFHQPPGMDSLTAKAFISAAMSFAGSVVYIFRKDGYYSEKENSETTCVGRYTVDAKASLINVTGKRNGYDITEKFRFKFKGSYLQLEDLKEGSNFELTLKKEK